MDLHVPIYAYLHCTLHGAKDVRSPRKVRPRIWWCRDGPDYGVTSISKQSLEKKKKKIIDKKDNVVLTFGRLNQWIKLVAWLRLATPIVTPLFMFEHTLFSYMYSCTSYNTRHLSSLAFFEPWEILRINVSRRATKLIFETRRVIMAIYVMHDVWPGCDHRLHLLIPVSCITFGQNLWVTSVPACSTNGRRARQILFLHLYNPYTASPR